LDCLVGAYLVSIGALCHSTGEQQILVFRDSMSPAAKFLDVLLERYASKFMLKALTSLSKKILKSAPFLEVNPAKVPDAAQLASNIGQVTQLAFDVLTQVFAASKKFPLYVPHHHRHAMPLALAGQCRSFLPTPLLNAHRLTHSLSRSVLFYFILFVDGD
jgi:hypothetical protein